MKVRKGVKHQYSFNHYQSYDLKSQHYVQRTIFFIRNFNVFLNTDILAAIRV